eukprot:g6570.t1
MLLARLRFCFSRCPQLQAPLKGICGQAPISTIATFRQSFGQRALKKNGCFYHEGVDKTVEDEDHDSCCACDDSDGVELVQPISTQRATNKRKFKLSQQNQEIVSASSTRLRGVRTEHSSAIDNAEGIFKGQFQLNQEAGSTSSARLDRRAKHSSEQSTQVPATKLNNADQDPESDPLSDVYLGPQEGPTRRRLGLVLATFCGSQNVSRSVSFSLSHQARNQRRTKERISGYNVSCYQRVRIPIFSENHKSQFVSNPGDTDVPRFLKPAACGPFSGHDDFSVIGSWMDSLQEYMFIVHSYLSLAPKVSIHMLVNMYSQC